MKTILERSCIIKKIPSIVIDHRKFPNVKMSCIIVSVSSFSRNNRRKLSLNPIVHKN